MKKVSLASKVARSCPECGHSHTKDYGIHRAFCLNCGYVPNGTEDYSRHCGNVPDDKTKIFIRPSSSEGGAIPQEGCVTRSEQDITLKRACDEWLKSAKASDQTEKNITEALYETTRIAIQLSLPKIVLKKASRLWKTILEKRLSRGRSIPAFSAAVVYIACRQCGVGITLDEITEVSKNDTGLVGRHCSILGRELNQVISLPRMEEYAPRILNKFHADERLAETVKRILNVVEELGLASGKDPRGIVSAAIYLASKLLEQRTTQRELSTIAHVTEMTIRKNCRILEKRIGFICTS